MIGTGDGGVVTQTVAQLPGMAKGEVGLAGEDKPGPSIRTVAIPAWQFIAIEIGWVYLHTFLGLLAIDGLGLVELAPPGEAAQHLLRVAGIALAPALLSMLQELYQYLGKVRAARL